MLLPEYLDVQILVVVFVQGRHGPGVADPEVDCVGGRLLKGDAREGDVILDVVEESVVFMAKVVILFCVVL